jgi:hypothetical protein
VTTATLRFDRGTLCIEGIDASDFPSVLWDERTAGHRAPAYAASAILEYATANGVEVARRPWPANALGGWMRPPLRDYQQSALDAWAAFGCRGIVVIPTGGGKTRVAVAALAKAAVPSAVLCPTRVLLDQWRSELGAWFQGPIGIIGDGEHRVEALTVMTFESAYRRMDEIGDRFAMLVIDEVHHFAGGTRAEALEMSTAPMRLGLTASVPYLRLSSSWRLLCPRGAQSPGRPDSQAGKEPPLLHDFNKVRGIPTAAAASTVRVAGSNTAQSFTASLKALVSKPQLRPVPRHGCRSGLAAPSDFAHVFPAPRWEDRTRAAAASPAPRPAGRAS